MSLITFSAIGTIGPSDTVGNSWVNKADVMFYDDVGDEQHVSGYWYNDPALQIVPTMVHFMSGYALVKNSSELQVSKILLSASAFTDLVMISSIFFMSAIFLPCLQLSYIKEHALSELPSLWMVLLNALWIKRMKKFIDS